MVELNFAYRDFLSMNGWPPGCHSTAQYEWYSYFEQLALGPSFCAEPVELLDQSKKFATHIFIGAWCALVYVAEEAASVNFCDLDNCIASAKELAQDSLMDVLVVSGSPNSYGSQMRLFNRKTLALEAGAEQFENKWVVVCIPRKELDFAPVGWCLMDTERRVYRLPGQHLHKACTCMGGRCKKCLRKYPRAPLWMPRKPKFPCGEKTSPTWETALVVKPSIERSV